MGITARRAYCECNVLEVYVSKEARQLPDVVGISDAFEAVSRRVGVDKMVGRRTRRRGCCRRFGKKYGRRGRWNVVLGVFPHRLYRKASETIQPDEIGKNERVYNPVAS